MIPDDFPDLEKRFGDNSESKAICIVWSVAKELINLYGIAL